MSKPIFGVMAQFDSAADLLTAAGKVRSANIGTFDCYSPFPIHGMDAVMGEKRSVVIYIAGFSAIAGGSSILALTAYVSIVDYPLIISGKPIFSWIAYSPIIFALSVLSAAFGSIFGFIKFMGLKYNHPVFNSERFKKVTDDGFFIIVEADSTHFNEEQAKQTLLDVGGKNVEVIEE